METAYFGLTSVQITFWSMLGIWLSSIGTITAVAISLYVSIRSNRLRLKITSNTARLPKPDDTSDDFDDIYFSIEAINICNWTITIEKIYLELSDKSSLTFPYQDNAYTTTLPKKLEYSEKATFMLSFQKNKEDLLKYIETLGLKNQNFNQWRIAIAISTGQIFRAKPHPNMIEKLEELKKAL